MPYEQLHCWTQSPDCSDWSPHKFLPQMFPDSQIAQEYARNILRQHKSSTTWHTTNHFQHGYLWHSSPTIRSLFQCPWTWKKNLTLKRAAGAQGRGVLSWRAPFKSSDGAGSWQYDHTLHRSACSPQISMLPQGSTQGPFNFIVPQLTLLVIYIVLLWKNENHQHFHAGIMGMTDHNHIRCPIMWSLLLFQALQVFLSWRRLHTNGLFNDENSHDVAQYIC